jgi:TolB-like protein
MSSIIEGYSYDIFISYRQNDNKYDGWVTEFVDNLNKELEATIKNKISVYFDINPHDGLLETHSVDRSLEEKLKCLIFIPVISQTYCDSKSFAWEHELCAFNKLAKEDKFGRDIRLIGSNVASRILPIKIHDLDPEDKTLLENELGGVLRCVEFIYNSAGVNRPLRASEDHPQDNLNKTYYRDQINKVANAVKEIITAFKKQNQRPEEIIKQDSEVNPSRQKNLRPKIIAGLIIALILVVLGLLIIPKLAKSEEQFEKSIAVLPFINESPVDSNKYFINGIMEEVLNNLQTIKDFRVLSRTSTNQYQGLDKPTIPEIAKKLNVSYIVEGSGQKYGNTFRLRVQLIKAKGKETHLWGNSYEQEIRGTNDIFNIQRQIAQAIAEELKTVITPEEKQLINKVPTSNLTAYDFYQQGREEHTKYWINNNSPSLQKAENLYHKSLKYDSAFAPAYCGLAWVCWDKHAWKENLSENFMDSVLILTNIALSFDDQLSEAHTLKGRYYRGIGKPDQAIEEFDKAIKFNPNDWIPYREKGEFYSFSNSNIDLVNAIKNYQKAVSINRGPELPALLWNIGLAYFLAGFPEKCQQYTLDKLKLDGDSLGYYDGLANIQFWLANFNKSNEYGEKGYTIDSTNLDILVMLGMGYAWLGQYKESLKYYKKYIEILKPQAGVIINYSPGIGYTYWQNGYKEEAVNIFNEEIEYDMNELKRSSGQSFGTYYSLASVYAFRGIKNEAYKNLRAFNIIQRVPFYMVTDMKNNPLFNDIRNEPEFQQIEKEIEAKYQAEHERVRKWLEENKML